MKHYAVTAQFGHVGRGKYLPKTIPVLAESGEAAAEKVRWMPRAKHHKKYAILNVVRITEEEYLVLREEHRKDPYFKVTSKKEQRELCVGLDEQVVEYEKPDLKKRKTERINKIKFKKKKDRIIQNEMFRQIRNYDMALAF